MQKRCLGKTGIEVSAVGLGTVKFGRTQGVKYPASFSLPSDNEINLLLETAAELGINLLDTAPAYGSSEERLGTLLYGRRHEWVIVSKAGEYFVDGQSHYDFSPHALQQSVEQSLRRLKTDYLDVLLVHSNGEDQRIIEEDHVFTTLAALKKSGKIRAYGMSTKTVSGGLLTVTEADVAMVTFNPQYTDEREVIMHAHAMNKGILVKKAFASGHQVQSAAETMKWIVNEPGVTSVIVGTINLAHLRENVSRLSGTY